MAKNRDDFVPLNVEAVRRIMEIRDIGRNALARLMRKGEREVGLWINGQRRPTKDNAQAMADVLGCDIAHLTGEKPSAEQPEETDPLGAPNLTAARGTSTAPTKAFLGIIKVDEHATSLDQNRLLELAGLIGRIVELGGEATFIGKPREGCMELTLRLTREQWSRLGTAFAEGKLADAKVIKVEPFFDLENDDDLTEVEQDLSIASKLEDMREWVAPPLTENALPTTMKDQEPGLLAALRTVIIAADLGNLLTRIGAYDEARISPEHALPKHRNTLGPKHPEVARSLDALGNLLTKMGAYTEAYSMLDHSLAIHRHNEGAEHVEVAWHLNFLGNLLTRMGAYDEARSMLQHALDIRRNALEPIYPEVARSLNFLGNLLTRMGAYDEARSMLQHALDIRGTTLIPTNPEVAGNLNDLGNLLTKMGAYDEARSMLELTVDLCRNFLEPEHPILAKSLNYLGNLLAKMGAYDEARSMLEHALAIRQHTLIPEYPIFAKSLNYLGNLLAKMGAYDEAYSMLEHALAIRPYDLGPEHPIVAKSLIDLGNLLTEMDAYDEAYTLIAYTLIARVLFYPPEK